MRPVTVFTALGSLGLSVLLVAATGGDAKAQTCKVNSQTHTGCIGDADGMPVPTLTRLGGSGNANTIRVTFPQGSIPTHADSYLIEAYGSDTDYVGWKSIPGGGGISYDDTEVDDRQSVSYRVKFRGDSFGCNTNEPNWEQYSPWAPLFKVGDHTPYSVSSSPNVGSTSEGGTVQFTANASNTGKACGQSACPTNDAGYTSSCTSCCTSSDLGFGSGFFNWGDGTPNTPVGAIGQAVSHTFTRSATRTVSLTMCDAGNNCATHTRNFVVNNVAPTVSAGNDQTVDETTHNATRTFTATASDPGGDPLTFDWDVNNGASITGGQGTASVTVRYTGVDGTTNVSVTVKVTDDNGATATDTALLRVQNVNPTVNPGGPYNVNEGGTVAATASGSDVGPSEGLTFQWDRDNDGNFDEEPSNATFVFNAANIDGGSSATQVTRCVRVKDNDGGSSTGCATFRVFNINPTADAGPNYSVLEGESVKLDGTGSTDAPADVANGLTFSWSGTGGFSASGARPDFSAANIDGTNSNSEATVTLTVTDGDGGSDTDSATINVVNKNPSVNPGGPYSVPEDGTTNVTAVGSDVPADQGSLTYAWDLNNNGQFNNANGATVQFNPRNFTFDGTSTKQICVRVSDDDGGSSSACTNVTITNVPPVANAGGPRTVNEGESITLNGSGTDPAGDLDPLTFTWSFNGPGGPFDLSGEDVAFSAAGIDGPASRQACLRVCDDEGDCDTECVQITIPNVAPSSVSPGGPYTVNEGSGVVLNGSATDVPGDTLTFEWSFNGPGGTFNVTGKRPTFNASTLNGPSEHDVCLRVRDDDGATSAPVCTKVTVNNVAPTVNNNGPYSVNEGGQVTLTVTATDPVDTLTPTWTIGGVARPAGQFSVTYDAQNDDGPETIQACVSVDDGATEVTSCTQINVLNVDPVLEIPNVVNVDEAGSVQLGTSLEQDHPGDLPLTIRWSLNGDDNVYETANPAPVFSAAQIDGPDTRVVCAQATDGDGGSAVDCGTVSIRNVAPTIQELPAFVVDEGSTVQLTRDASDPFDPLTSSWSLNGDDGIHETPGETVVFDATSRSGPDSQVVCAFVDDGDGGTAKRCGTVTINNVPPTVDDNGPYSVDEGSSVDVSATVSDPVDNVNVRWDLDNDDTFESAGATVAFSADGLDGPSTHTICVEAVDTDGARVERCTFVTVLNVAPVVDALGPYTVDEGGEVNVGATGSDAGNDPISYAWSFTGLGGAFDVFDQNPIFSADGRSGPDSQQICVRASDDDGGSSTDCADVTINNVAPTVNPQGPYSVTEFGNVQLTATVSDPGADVLTTSWSLTGSGGPFNAAGESVNFSAVGRDGRLNETQEVCVRTNDGTTTTTECTIVEITNVPPTVDAGGPYTINEGTQLGLSAASFDIAGALDPLVIAWDLDNNGSFESLGENVVFDATNVSGPSSHTVGVQADDGDGGLDTDTATINVDNVDPTVSTNGPYTVDEGSIVQLNATGSDVVDVVEFSWDLDNNGSFESPGAVVDFSAVGRSGPDNQVVCALADDNDGGTATECTNVQIDNVAPTLNAFGPFAVDEGSSVNVTATGSDPVDAITFAWSLDGNDGTFTTPNQTVVFDATNRGGPDTREICVQVTDVDGATDSGCSQVTINNVPPTIAFDAAPYSVFEADSVQLTVTVDDAGPDALTTTFSLTGAAGPFDVNGTSATLDAALRDGPDVQEVCANVADGTTDVTVCTDVLIDNADPTVDPGGPYEVDEGLEIQLTATGSDPAGPVRDPLVYTWNLFAGGGFQPGAVVTFSAATYDGPTSQEVSVSVDDGDGGLDTETVDIIINNSPPVLTVPSELAHTEEGSLWDPQLGVFTDSGFGEQLTATVYWDDNDHPVEPADVTFVNGSGVINGDYVYSDGSPHNVVVSISDDDGGFDSGVFTVEVANQAPTVEAGQALAVDEGANVSLLGATFNDLGTRDTHTATLDWGDGSAPVAANVTQVPFGPPGVEDGQDGSIDGSWIYGDDGVYTVTLTVTDDDGDSGSDTTTVTVSNVAPTVTAGADITTDEGLDTLITTATFSDPGFNVASANTLETFTSNISFGDGKADEAGTLVVVQGSKGNATTGNLSVTHNYDDNGQYTVTSTITDDDSGSNSDTLLVTVDNVDPTCDISGPASVRAGAIEEWNVAPSDQSPVDVLSVAWDFGDTQTAGNDTRQPHRYVAQGQTFTITVTVTDDDNGSSTCTHQVSVENSAPTGTVSTLPASPISNPGLIEVTLVTSEQVVSASLAHPTLGQVNLVTNDGIKFVGVLNIPAGVCPGSKGWVFSADDGQLTGNVLTSGASVNICTEDRSDLRLGCSDIVYNPPLPAVGDAVTFSGVLLNGGDAVAQTPDGVMVHTYVQGGELLASTNFDKVDPGLSVTFGGEIDAGAEGLLVVRHLADPSNDITETDDRNNGASRSMFVGARGNHDGIIDWYRPLLTASIDGTTQPFGAIDIAAGQNLRIGGAVGYNPDNNVLGDDGALQGGRITVTIPGAGASVAGFTNDAGVVVDPAGGAGLNLGSPPPGDYTLRVDINDCNASQSITVPLRVIPVAPGAVDLFAAPNGISLSNATPQVGTEVTVSVALQNLGTEPTGNGFTVRFVDLTTGTVLGEAAAAAMNGQTSQTVSVTHTFNDAGFHRIGVVLDVDNEVVEDNEANNENERLFEIIDALPDLRVVGLSLSDPTPVEFQDVTLTATVRNVGASTNTDMDVRFWDGERLCGTTRLNGLNGSGTNVSVSVDCQLITRGQRTLRVTADANDDVAEGNEANNTLERIVTVHAPRPDLNLRGIAVLDGPPTLGQPLTIGATATNLGELDVASVEVSLRKCDLTERATPTCGFEVGQRQTVSVDAGELAPVNLVYPAVDGGVYRLVMVIDPDDLFAEVSESNNVNAVRVLANGIDLEVFATSLSTDVANVGDIVTAFVDVRNSGDTAALDVVVRCSRDGIAFDEHLVDLPAFSSASVDCEIPAGSEGVHQVDIAIDPDGVIAELVEGNNFASEFYMVGGRPDLVALGLAATNSTPTRGETITLTATARNDGDQDGLGGTATFSDGGNVFATRPFNCARNEICEVSAPFSTGGLPFGARDLTVEFDVPGEQDASDNSATLQIVVLEPEAPPTASINIAPASPIVEPTLLSVTLIASKPVNGVSLGFRVNGGALVNVANLATADNVTYTGTVSIDGSTGDGTATWSWSGVDSGGRVGNGITSGSTFEIDLAQDVDLAVACEDIGLSATQLNAGDSVNVDLTLHNEGELVAIQAPVRLTNAGLVFESTTDVLPGGVTSFATSYSPAGPGLHVLTFSADPNDTIAEQNEGNNVATRAVIVGDIDEATRITLDNDASINVNPGEQILVEGAYSYPSAGLAAAGATVRVSIPGETPTIEGRSDANGRFSLRLGAPIAPGAYVAVVSASDCTDIALAQFEIVVDPPVVNLPDLAVADHLTSVSNPTPTVGDQITINYVLQNGGVAASGNVPVTVYVGGSAISTSTVASVGAGQSRTESLNYVVQNAGPQQVSVVVDPANTIQETDEGNNSAVTSFVGRAALPDVALLALTASDNAPSTDTDISLSARVINLGGAVASGVVIRMVDGGRFLGQVELGDLQPGQETIASVLATLAPAGQHLIIASADPANTIAESNETNNEAEAQITSHDPKPDAAFGPLTLDPALPATGQQVALRTTLRNDGETDLENVVVSFRADGQELSNLIILSLAPGAEQAVSGLWVAARGLHNLSVVADPADQIDEVNEGNNTAATSVNVVDDPPADLVVTSNGITFDNPAPLPGDNLTATAVVRNQGGEAAANVAVDFLLDGAFIAREFIVQLGAGAQTTVSTTFPAGAEGLHLLRVVADPDNRIVEALENNNGANRNYFSGDRPDLVLTDGDVSFSKDGPALGEVVSLTANVANTGTADALGVVVRFYDGNPATGGLLLGSSGPRDIAGGTSRAFTLPWITQQPIGQHRIFAVADPADLVPEQSELNNQGSKLLDVQDPPPNVEAGPNQSGDEADEYSFSGSFSDLGDASNFTIEWNFNDPNDATTANTLDAVHTFNDNGVYDVILSVTDAAGGLGQDRLTVTVANVAPVVDALPDFDGTEGVQADFTVTFSDVSPVDTHTFQWLFGDGNTADTQTVSHTWLDNGVYNVDVTVTDDDGGATSIAFTSTIVNANPIVDAGPDVAINEGDLVALPPGSFTDLGVVDVHTSFIDWGDGVLEAATVNQGAGNGTLDASHTYADDSASPYVAGLTVTDNDGGNGFDSFQVTVANVNPTIAQPADFTADEGGTEALPTLSFTDPGFNHAAGGTIESFTALVDFGDGDTATPAPVWTTGSPGVASSGTVDVTHVWQDEGIYTVTSTVTDDDGGFDTVTNQVTVQNRPPVLNAGDDQATDEGTEINPLNATVSDFGDDVITGTATWGDGSAASPLQMTLIDAGGPDQPRVWSIASPHTFCDNGSYNVTLNVDDGDGGTDSDAFQVTVANVAPVVPDFGDLTINEGDTLALDVLFRDAGACDTHTGTIDFAHPAPAPDPLLVGNITETPGVAGDAGPLEGTISNSFFYCDNYDLVLTVCVSDDDGAETCRQQNLTVENVPPVITMTTPVMPRDMLEEVPFHISVSDPGTCDTIGAGFVSWGDGSPNEEIATNFTGFTGWDPAQRDVEKVFADITHVYFEGGVFNTKTFVADDDGGVGQDLAGVTAADDTGMRIFRAGACRPAAPGGDVVTVRKDGTGDFETIQAAIDFIAQLGGDHKLVNIGPGLYEETVLVESLDFISGGQGADGIPPFMLIGDCIPGGNGGVDPGLRAMPVLDGTNLPGNANTHGVHIIGPCDVTEEGNVGIDGLMIQNFNSDGLAVNCGGGAKITNITTTQNGDHGVELNGADGSWLLGITSIDDGIHGLAIRETDNATIINSYVEQPGDIGIIVRNSVNTYFLNPEVHDSPVHGISVAYDDRFAGTCEGTIIQGARIMNSFQESIFTTGCAGTWVRDSVLVGGGTHGVSAYNGSDTVAVTNSVIRDHELGAAVYTEDVSTVLIRDNISDSNFEGFVAVNTTGGEIFNNLSSDDVTAGIVLSNSDGFNIKNNSVDKPNSSRAGIEIKETSCNSIGCAVMENLVFNNGGGFSYTADFTSRFGIFEDFNLFYGPNGGIPSQQVGPNLNAGANTLFEDPQIVDKRMVLATTSPAIDAGSRTALEASFQATDLEPAPGVDDQGNPDLGQVDIGYHHHPDRDRPDYDGDGVHELLDNCPDLFNELQEDGNGDGVGDACTLP